MQVQVGRLDIACMMQQPEISDAGKPKGKVITQYGSDSEDLESDDYNCCGNCDLVLCSYRLLHGFSVLICLLCLSANVFAIVTYDVSYRDIILRL